ncbi:MAG: AEC family transporter [Lachnospiraceae bacterium]|nr:AEC family transporter [Lachnospiraceae bacterium]
MENFMFSLNATFPIFLVILVGWFLKQVHMLNDDFVTTANKFNFTVTLPALVFKDLAAADVRHDFDGGYVVFCAFVTTISFFTIWGLTRLLMKDKSMRGAFVQAAFRSSAAVLGFAFIQNIYGESKLASLMIIGTVPLFNIYSVIVLTFEGEGVEDQKGKIAASVKNICKNPIILAILAGTAVSLLQIRFPVMINKTIQYLANMATPLALIALGAGFEGKAAIARIRPTVLAAMVKLVILPLVFLPLAVHMGYIGEKMVALIVMLGSPTTTSCYIMAKNMKNDGALTSSIVVMTTLLASVTLTFWVYIMKSQGLI